MTKHNRTIVYELSPPKTRLNAIHMNSSYRRIHSTQQLHEIIIGSFIIDFIAQQQVTLHFTIFHIEYLSK